MRFVADAAHELRSPLTALKLQMQLLLRATDDAARKAAQALTAGIDRAARLIEQLLALARAEPGAPATPQASVDLSEAVRAAVAQTVPFATIRGTQVELFADTPVTIQGDAAALTALARDLVDNAVRTTPRARASNCACCSTPACVLQVDDAGPGIAPADRERVFNRSISHAAGDESGSGLGLAIVAASRSGTAPTVTLGESPAAAACGSWWLRPRRTLRRSRGLTSA